MTEELAPSARLGLNMTSEFVVALWGEKALAVMRGLVVLAGHGDKEGRLALELFYQDTLRIEDFQTDWKADFGDFYTYMTTNTTVSYRFFDGFLYRKEVFVDGSCEVELFVPLGLGLFLSSDIQDYGNDDLLFTKALVVQG